ncbi:hypothetical protein G9A89_010326 [Geosiphon pyriformis]|nr:hypothetical protein G9A89_010326 [Geosiphon pyriformis]
MSKSGPSNSTYSDVESLSGDDEDVSMFGVNGESLLGLVATTSKAKQINTRAIFGSPLGFPNFHMDDNEVAPVEVSIKKLFALNINFLAVEEKLAMAKTQLIRNFFSSIIRFTFTSEKSMEMAVLLAREKGITINSNLKKQEICSDWAIVIKKILINTPKEMIIAAAMVEFTELDQANLLAFKWSFLISKDSVHVAKTVKDCEIWVSRDQFRALLFTLPVHTTAHDLGTLLESTGRKICIINRSIETGNRICCAMVGFDSNDNLESFHTEPILGGIKLSWTRMDLVWYKKCGKIGHFALEYDALVLTKLYEKKSVLISRPVAFNNKFWAQVALHTGFSGLHFASGSGSSFLGTLDLNSSFSSVLVNNSSLDLLTDQVSGIIHKLEDIELVPQASSFSSKVSDILITAKENLALDMIMDNSELILPLSSFASPDVSTLGLSFLGTEVAIIMDISLACYVSKVEEVSGQLISVHFLFKNKLLVTILGLYSGASSNTYFSQAANVNFIISIAVNSSSFVVLDGDFNENKSKRSASFKFCLDLGLVNTFNEHLLAQTPTWSNSRGVKKVIDFIFVNKHLVSTIASHIVENVSNFFNTDHKSVLVSIGLGELLDACLISAHRQAN